MASDDCTIDKVAIQNYYNRKAGFSFIPFLGDSIGGAIMKTPPSDSSFELSNVQSQIQVTQTSIVSELSKLSIQTQGILQNLFTLLLGTPGNPGYVQATASLTVEPVNEKVTLISVQLIALVVVVLIIIFVGI